jgi:hypothetical protein
MCAMDSATAAIMDSATTAIMGSAMSRAKHDCCVLPRRRYVCILPLLIYRVCLSSLLTKT